MNMMFQICGLQGEPLHYTYHMDVPPTHFIEIFKVFPPNKPYGSVE